MRLAIKKKEFIQTERLTLKPYSQADTERLTYLITNQEITRYFMVPDFETTDQIAAAVEKIIAFSQTDDTRHLEYGIYLNEILIGFINDCGVEEDMIEIGYVIDPNYQGYGYASEAVRTVINELKEMGFKKITAGYFSENTASRKVMEKCGMKKSALVEEEEYRGLLHKCFFYEICF
ncbi:MAG: GNAT family N-acetyltransferase [Firmicutes bacterium]|nr:GNAT family N-acetyltransferase [Bacillota bacterium]